MSAVLLFNGIPATECTGSARHDPVPLRYLWHHVQPVEAGGDTTAANLVQLCDSCHMSVHLLMWYMARQELSFLLHARETAILEHPPRRLQYELAVRGFKACTAAGTVEKIPREG